MTLNALDLSSKESWQFVRFVDVSTGNTLAAYTNKDSAETFEGVDYTSETALEIELPENNGTLGEAECKVRLPISDAFTQSISFPTAIAPMEIYVTEFARGTGAASAIVRPFQGQVDVIRKNALGRIGFLEVSAIPIKARLQIALGEPCNHQCINNLGEGRCGVILNAGNQGRLTVSISAIDGKKVTLTTSIATGLQDRFYQGGYMQVGGLTLGITLWRNEIEGNKQDFFLSRRPPDSWLVASVTLVAGCDKTIETCRSRWNGEEFFNGRGYAMPSYHPNYEDGGDRQ